MTWTESGLLVLAIIGTPPFLFICVRFVTAAFYSAREDFLETKNKGDIDGEK